MALLAVTPLTLLRASVVQKISLNRRLPHMITPQVRKYWLTQPEGSKYSQLGNRAVTQFGVRMKQAVQHFLYWKSPLDDAPWRQWCRFWNQVYKYLWTGLGYIYAGTIMHSPPQILSSRRDLLEVKYEQCVIVDIVDVSLLITDVIMVIYIIPLVSLADITTRNMYLR